MTRNGHTDQWAVTDQCVYIVEYLSKDFIALLLVLETLSYNETPRSMLHSSCFGRFSGALRLSLLPPAVESP